MGIFDIFKSKPENQGVFISEEDSKKNQSRQIEMAPDTIAQLREIEVTEDKELKLEYFFYTNTMEKAKTLANYFETLNYSVSHGQSAGDRNLFIVTGWTNKMKMDGRTIILWISDMCEVGLKYDCEFDGWGTTPDQ